jgi:hypothetical protein
VVAHQPQLTVDVEGRHPVVSRRCRGAVGHLRSGSADDGVFKTFRQGDYRLAGVASLRREQGAVTPRYRRRDQPASALFLVKLQNPDEQEKVARRIVELDPEFQVIFYSQSAHDSSLSDDPFNSSSLR